METTARSVPWALASVLEELELRQPKLVTRELLREILAQRTVDLTVDDAADRLRRHGWLLSLKTRGAWEFAPAARAGPLGSGDPYIEIRATLYRRPDFPVAVAYESAAWLHNLARRQPEKDVISVPKKIVIPPALRQFRVTHSVAKLPTVKLDELPVWRLETLLILMSERPTAYRAWPTASEWLPELRSRVEKEAILQELDGKPGSTWARAGYLLERAGLRDLADDVDVLRPQRRGPFYLGRRGERGSHYGRWDVIDTAMKRFGPPEAEEKA